MRCPWLELDLSPRRVDLLGENFDLPVRMGDLPDDALLAAHRLTALSCGLYAAPEYLARHGNPDHPNDLLGLDSLRIFERDREPAEWSLPAHTAWAVFPGRRPMPAKTRVFIETLETTISGKPSAGNIPSHPAPTSI